MRDGLVVASCGRYSAMASKSPVSATTVVERFRESRRFMVSPLVESRFAERHLTRGAGPAGARPAVSRQVLQEEVDHLGGVGDAGRGGDLFDGLRRCGKGCE